MRGSVRNPRCVRIDRVDAFSSHVEWIAGGEQ
jgi:hypothetical protein